MVISGWSKKYSEIQKEFGYNKKQDKKSAIVLESILRKEISEKKIREVISGKTVFVVGAGPSLSLAIPKLKKFKKNLIDYSIVPDERHAYLKYMK